MSPQLFFLLPQRKGIVRIKGAVYISPDLRAAAESAGLVYIGETECRYAVFDRVVKGILLERTNAGVVGPDVGFGIDADRNALLYLMLYGFLEMPHGRKIVRQRQCAHVGRHPTQNRHGNIVRVHDHRNALRVKKGGNQCVGNGLGMVSIEKKGAVVFFQNLTVDRPMVKREMQIAECKRKGQ